MLKTFIPAVCLSASLLYSCNNGTDKDLSNQENPGQQDYFPVTGFFQSELGRIDSLQLPVTLFRSEAGKKDTLALSIEESKSMAAPFLEYDITESPLKEKFQESSFADQSIPSITFTYHTKDSSLPLKRVDVVLSPDPVKADRVKSVYMEKQYLQNDTLVEEKMYWKAEHYYQVIRTRQTANMQPVISQIKVVWDPTE